MPAKTPNPIPTSFARESFFAVSAFKFTNAAGVSRFGRYRLQPAAGNEYLSAEDAAKKSPNFLFDEMTARLAKGPVEFRIIVQLAAEGDEVADATACWPADRPEPDFGTVTLTKRVNEHEAEMRKIIFDPVPPVDGIEPSADPFSRCPRSVLSFEAADADGKQMGNRCAARVAPNLAPVSVSPQATGGIKLKSAELSRTPY